jgi:DNA adenine methylase
MKTTVLKYAGNKRKLMAAIRPYLGGWDGVNRYVEPFCGSLGSALNAEIPEGIEILLSDANEDLINLYRELIKDPKAVETLTNKLPLGETEYYEIRSWDRQAGWPDCKTSLERAARTLYLNKRGFNGLYRTNRSGQFSTPWNRNLNPKPVGVMEHADFLCFIQKHQPFVSDWSEVVEECGAGDLIYCDPPYVDPKDPKREFLGYVGNFGWEQQVRLRDALVAANARGARILVSNSWCEATLELYAGWEMIELSAERYISSKGDGRKPVSEVLARLL